MEANQRPESKAIELLAEIILESMGKPTLSNQQAKCVAMKITSEMLALPFHKWMSEKQANEFCEYWQQVRKFITEL